MFRSFDAAFPPLTAPPGCAAVLGYLGPENYTPHVWTTQEWRRFASFRQAGLWLYSRNLDAIKMGATAGLAYRQLGWTPNAPTRRVIWVDMEAQEDDAWLEQFAAENNAVGFDTGKYNSLSAGLELPPGVKYEWEAQWNGVDNVPPGANAHQFQANVPWQRTLVDYSEWDQAMWDTFGWGPRR